jgi:anti-anti-sigma factor
VAAATAAAGVVFRCDVAYVEDRAVIAVRGEVDLGTASTLQREILATLALPIAGVVLDLAYVTFMDSSGVAVLVAAQRQASDLGRPLTLTSVPRQVRVVLEISGLSQQFGLTSISDARRTPSSGIAP